MNYRRTKSLSAIFLIGLGLAACQEETTSKEKQDVEEVVEVSDVELDTVILVSDALDQKEFEEIIIYGLPEVKLIDGYLLQYDLYYKCEEYGIDQLDKDLLFTKTASKPFEEYSNLKLSSGEVDGKTYVECFDITQLKLLYNASRDYFKSKGG